MYKHKIYYFLFLLLPIIFGACSTRRSAISRKLFVKADPHPVEKTHKDIHLSPAITTIASYHPTPSKQSVSLNKTLQANNSSVFPSKNTNLFFYQGKNSTHKKVKKNSISSSVVEKTIPVSSKKAPQEIEQNSNERHRKIKNKANLGFSFPFISLSMYGLLLLSIYLSFLASIFIVPLSILGLSIAGLVLSSQAKKMIENLPTKERRQLHSKHTLSRWGKALNIIGIVAGALLTALIIALMFAF